MTKNTHNFLKPHPSPQAVGLLFVHFYHRENRVEITKNILAVLQALNLNFRKTLTDKWLYFYDFSRGCCWGVRSIF